jgi:hypothetical protein
LDLRLEVHAHLVTQPVHEEARTLEAANPNGSGTETEAWLANIPKNRLKSLNALSSGVPATEYPLETEARHCPCR